MTVIPYPGVTPALIIRAAAHVISADLYPVENFRAPVRDLDVARLLYALDAGVPVLQGGRGRWTVPDHSPLSKAQLPAIVDEAIRTGLARGISKPTGPDVVRVHLVAAPTHLRRPRERMKPVCEARALRYRLINYTEYRRNKELVDCTDCLHAY